MKKVNFTKTPVEYELAPYEMLMSDIQKGPRLNKIMVDGELPPRLKKDAHDIILQFIKARPPLKPVRKKNVGINLINNSPKLKYMLEILFNDEFLSIIMLVKKVLVFIEKRLHWAFVVRV